VAENEQDNDKGQGHDHYEGKSAEIEIRMPFVELFGHAITCELRYKYRREYRRIALGESGKGPATYGNESGEPLFLYPNHLTKRHSLLTRQNAYWPLTKVKPRSPLSP